MRRVTGSSRAGTRCSISFGKTALCVHEEPLERFALLGTILRPGLRHHPSMAIPTLGWACVRTSPGHRPGSQEGYSLATASGISETCESSTWTQYAIPPSRDGLSARTVSAMNLRHVEASAHVLYELVALRHLPPFRLRGDLLQIVHRPAVQRVSVHVRRHGTPSPAITVLLESVPVEPDSRAAF